MDNALAESTIGLFKTEVINFLGTWKTVDQVEWETLKWVNWYNNERLHSAIGYVTPQEAEEAFYENLNNLHKVAYDLNETLSGEPGSVQIPSLPRPSTSPPIALGTVKRSARIINWI